MAAAAAKKTKVVTHRQQSTKIGSRRNISGGSNGNGKGNDKCNGDDGNSDSGNNDNNNSGNGSGGGKEDKCGDTQTTIN